MVAPKLSPCFAEARMAGHADWSKSLSAQQVVSCTLSCAMKPTGMLVCKRNAKKSPFIIPSWNHPARTCAIQSFTVPKSLLYDTWPPSRGHWKSRLPSQLVNRSSQCPSCRVPGKGQGQIQNTECSTILRAPAKCSQGFNKTRE